MSEMNDKEPNFSGLIDEMAGELTPVKPLDLPIKRLFKWFGTALFCGAAGLAVAGLRPDFSTAVSHTSFWLRAVCLLGLCLLSALAALSLAMPGEEKGRRTVLFPMIALFAWAIAILTALINGFGVDSFKWGFGCTLHITFISVAPAIVLFWMIKKASPFKLGMSGFLAMVSAAAVGALARQFSCAVDDPYYLLIWHFAPVMAIGFLGVWIGQKILR